MQRLQPVRVPHLIGAGLRVAAPLDPLDARPDRRPREPRPGRVRALLFAGGGPPRRALCSLPRRLGPPFQRCGPRVRLNAPNIQWELALGRLVVRWYFGAREPLSPPEGDWCCRVRTAA
jgi:hypothetical protein